MRADGIEAKEITDRPTALLSQSARAADRSPIPRRAECARTRPVTLDAAELRIESLIHAPTLLTVTAAVLLGIVAAMCAFGATQRVYRGYWVWVAAIGIAPLAVAGIGLGPGWPMAAILAGGFLMAGPVMLLLGLRRFHARDAQFASAGVDGLVLAGCFGAWVILRLSPMFPAAVEPTALAVTLEATFMRPLVFTMLMLGLHLYAAWGVARFSKGRHGVSLKMMVGVLLVLSTAPALLLAWQLGPLDAASANPPPWATLAVLPWTIGMIAIAYLCLVLTHERTVGDLLETQRQLRVLADIDMLTQVPNRRRIEELAQRIVGKMGSKPTVLMLFDIDHFKRINDTHGHATGDDALRVVARCARKTLRSRDVLGRIGGDEFMLLLPGATVDHALHIADRITRRLDTQRRHTRLPLSLSFGVVQVEIGETIESARRRADAALYEAKRQGRRRAVPAELRGRDTVFGESRPLGLDPLQPV